MDGDGVAIHIVVVVIRDYGYVVCCCDSDDCLNCCLIFWENHGGRWIVVNVVRLLLNLCVRPYVGCIGDVFGLVVLYRVGFDGISK